jgi:hypothetical protein
VTRVAQEELYAKLLTQTQGAFGTNTQIDMVAPNGEADPSDIEAGMVVYLDTNTQSFKLGMAGYSLPYFAKPAGGYNGVPAAGNVYGDGILALPACVPYRMITNNYAAGTYNPGTPLGVVNTGASKGKVSPGSYYNDHIVGIVARGVLTNYDKAGRSVLEFFTYWLPALHTQGSTIS